jgi:hypothetical protein
MIEQFLPFIFIAIFLVFVVGRMAYSHFANQKRLKKLEELAGELGLDWFEDGNSQQLSRHSGFNLFNQGRARKMQNLIEGVTDEVQIGVFDYQFTTGNGKNQRTTRQTVASLASPQLNCPDFDSHPKFSGNFVLKGPNEEAIRSFFQPAVLEFFETQTGIRVEGRGNTMCFYRAGKVVKPDQIKDLLGDAYRVFGCLVDA